MISMQMTNLLEEDQNFVDLCLKMEEGEITDTESEVEKPAVLPSSPTPSPRQSLVSPEHIPDPPPLVRQDGTTQAVGPLNKELTALFKVPSRPCPCSCSPHVHFV